MTPDFPDYAADKAAFGRPFLWLDIMAMEDPKNPKDLPVPSRARKAGNTALDILAAATQIVTSPKDAVFTGIRLVRAKVAGRF